MYVHCKILFLAIFRLTAKYSMINTQLIVELHIVCQLPVNTMHQDSNSVPKCVVCKLYIVHSSHSEQQGQHEACLCR